MAGRPGDEEEEREREKSKFITTRGGRGDRCRARYCHVPSIGETEDGSQGVPSSAGDETGRFIYSTQLYRV